MKKILVTGANGQLGLSIKAVGKNYPSMIFTFTDVEDLDITNSKEVISFFENNKFDYCVNCAAYTAVDKAEEDVENAFSINATAVKNLSIACKNSNVVLIHVSTDFVFDGLKKTPYSEEDLPNPLSVYGSSKLKGEQFIQDILDSYFIVRTSWLYSEYGNNFVKTMLRLSETYKEINVVDDQIGSPTYAGDLAEFIISVISLESELYGVYHFSNEGNISWYDFAVEIFEKSQRQIKVNPIESTSYPTAAKRPAYSVLGTTKAKKLGQIKIKNWKESLSMFN
ncbi:MAG: dTDP-4-dehydrorhamnose reductase [Flavobacteriaceae bacterium]|nr:dTDP-4-dehydrorhamnose reductase [Flavobacteriaceae bacterium]